MEKNGNFVKISRKKKYKILLKGRQKTREFCQRIPKENMKLINNFVKNEQNAV